jgi:acyl carrier protein
MSDFKTLLKERIIEQLNLEDLTPDDINNSDVLFGDQGLGLDSIDALEFIVLLEQHYSIKLTDPSQGREIFHSIDTLAEFIQSQQS